MYPQRVFELSRACIAFFILLSVITCFCMVTHFKVLLAIIKSCCGRRKLSKEENMETRHYPSRECSKRPTCQKTTLPNGKHEF
ncbi:uncharacterized protein LOC125039669 isoform X3 [Penaeus chinensis]|uniref:uncharacterized protein LOC125039669 isoform X3 n=1 Tax=Penaeus chinensis TaxID=139456 RepID=UPI001FB84AAF|nr:uncharacterized protein LOC125039669 isoform X3 [Penaeus chinensis]